MAARLYAMMPDSVETGIRLVRVERDEVKDVRAAGGGQEVTVFVPGVDVAIHHTALPTKGERETRQAAPFAIEDEIATSVTEVHVALGPRPEDLSAPRELLVVSETTMDEWLERLADLGVSSARLVAEQSAIGDGQVLHLGSRIVGRVQSLPFAIDAQLPDGLVSALLEGEHVTPQAVSDPLAALALSAESLEIEPIDLRQGAFARGGGFGLAALEGWRMAAGLAVALIAGWLIAGMLEIRASSIATDGIRDSIRTQYAAVFPDAPAPADPTRAVSRALGGAGGGSSLDFIDTSATLYAALTDVPNASLRSIRFDTARGGYTASIAYANYGDDAALKSAIEARGLQAILGDARRGGDLVFGDVTITEASR
ncbi:MAG: type II secretion system protein GspL [Pseudomonadota bacterium]